MKTWFRFKGLSWVAALCMIALQNASAQDFGNVAGSNPSTESSTARGKEQEAAENEVRTNPKPRKNDSSVSCPHDAKSDLPCAGTAVPQNKDVDELWRKLIAVIQYGHGYVTPEQVEHLFVIRFANIDSSGNGHRSASFESGPGLPLSIGLDVYTDTSPLPAWRRFQGELNRGRSILNIAGGDFGCVPLTEAEKKLTDAGLVLQGSVIYQVANLGKSTAEFADLRDPTTVILYFDKPMITGSCVNSMRIIGYR